MFLTLKEGRTPPRKDYLPVRKSSLFRNESDGIDIWTGQSLQIANYVLGDIKWGAGQKAWEGTWGNETYL